MTRILSVFNLLRRVGFAVFLLGANSFAQGPDTLWTRVLHPDWASHMFAEGAATLDSQSLYISSTYLSTDGTYGGVSLTKYSADGTLEWVRTCGDSTFAADEAYMCAVGTEYLAIVGMIWGEEALDPYLLIVDQEGETVLERTYDLPGLQMFVRVASASSESIFLSFRTESFSFPNASVDWLLLNSQGDIQNSGAYFETNNRYWPFGANASTMDGSYVICSSAIDDVAGNGSALIIKVNATGELLWSRKYDQWPDDTPYSVAFLQSGDIAFCGYSIRYDGVHDAQPFAMVVNSQGDSLWSWTYPLPEHTDGGSGTAITGTLDGGFTFSYNLLYTNYLIHFNAAFQHQWTREHHLPIPYLRQSPKEILHDHEGAYSLVGMCSDSTTFESYLYAIKIEPDESAVRQRPPAVLTDLNLSVFPNPFNSTTEITFDIPRTSYASLKVYDLLGREQVTLVDDVVQSGATTVRWDAAGFASGIYFARLVAGEVAVARKVALIK